MAPRTGLIRVPREPVAPEQENHHAPQHMLELPEQENQFAHPDPPALLEAAIEEENHHAPQHLLELPEQENQFAHPDPSALLEAVIEEVALGGLSIEQELKVVKNKIKDAVELDDMISKKKLSKLANEVKYLKSAMLSEQVDQHME